MHLIESPIVPVRMVRSLATFAALTFALLIFTDEADARFSGGAALGGRGIRAIILPSLLPIADVTNGAPDRRLMVQALQPVHPGTAHAGMAPVAAPGRPDPLEGFAAGFLASGLLGLLFGHGLAGGLNDSEAVLGLLFQLALAAMLGRLFWTWWRSGEAAAVVHLSPRQLADAYGRSRQEILPDINSPASADVALNETDYDTFERLQREIRAADGCNDADALRARLTPQMLLHVGADGLAHDGHGVLDANVRLIKEDLAEAWREGEVEYAAVTMHYALAERPIEPSGGRLAESLVAPSVKASEVWTFSRAAGCSWLLTAID